MNPVDQMQIFARVAELASFTQAADALGLPKASVSTAVQQLEARLGTRLLHRTTRKVQLTQDGQVFYDRCKDVLADVDELQGMFRQGGETLRGRVRVDMSTGAARHMVIPRLPELLRQHPLLEIEISSTERRVDLVREGFDCVLRTGSVGSDGLVARPLGAFRQINCASPGYLAHYGRPETLESLAGHRLVHFAASFGARPVGFEYVDADGKDARRAMPGAVTVNNGEAYGSACLAGLGLIQVPEIGVRHLLASGALVEVLPQFSARAMPLTLLYANRRNLSPRVRVVMDWLAQVAADYVGKTPAGTA